MQGRLLPCLVLVLAVAACLVRADTAVSTPLMAWSSEGLFSTEAGSAALEAVSDLKAFLGDLIEGVVRPAGAEAPAAPLLDAAALAEGSAPEVVLVLLGSELRTSDLRRKRAAPLQALVDAARSSLAVPYVLHPFERPALSAGELRDALEARLPHKLETAGCGEGRGLHELPELLPAGAGPRVVLGCTAGGGGGSDGVAGELEQVRAAHDAVAALGRRLVTLYAVAPGAAALELAGGGGGAEQRRRLAAVGVGPYTVCDAVCRTQVKWLEGMLALLLVIVAALSGMCCLGVLDTPTRFESPKDSQRND
ncbi:MAG: hypothetical protein J3K34DRAFT_419821 [Monoraphidium minutum]|nr:MAG: hypothetical protein J3K34DRAFT_419821 [Monoraphidium minutum]